MVRLVVTLISIFFLAGCSKPSFQYVGLGDDGKKTSNPPSQNPSPSPTATPSPCGDLPIPDDPDTTPIPTQPCPKPTPVATPTPTPSVPTPTPTPTPTPPVTEYFEQHKENTAVDILFVADDSYSMAEQQKEMGKKFPSFAKALAGVDYQIGIITTDVNSNSRDGSKGRLSTLKGPQASGKILSSSHPKAEQIFAQTIKRGINGSTDEQPMAATIMAVEKRNAENVGFFRDSVDLAVVYLSDEDEKSEGKKGTTAAQVLTNFKSVFGNTKKLAAYGIVIVPGDKACLEEQGKDGSGTGSGNAFYATRVAELARLTGGSVHSICSPDYSAPLKTIGESVGDLISTFVLSRDPVPGTVVVKLSSGEQASYRVEGRKVIFLKKPALGTRIEITYTPAN